MRIVSVNNGLQTNARTPPRSAPATTTLGEMGQGLVVFDHVQKSYDGQQLVVKDLCVTVGQGEFLTLLGPSGSGKTTSLMMLAGFERPTSGHIYLDGKPVESLPPEKRNIGFVFQNYALFPHMTVAENIAFPLRYRGLKGRDAIDRVDKALDMVRLSGFGGRKPGQLSGGQQQRVALARALVFEPRLVLMDEPLGALDKQLRERMQYEIKQLQRQLAITVVYVTHDQSEALTMSDRVAVFHNGRIQQIAGPIEIYDRPANAFVAEFIGENNLIPVKLLKTDSSGTRVVTTNGVEFLSGAPADNASGDLVLAIRPERIRILGPGETAAGANDFEGTVTGFFFQGDHIRYQVSGLGVETLTIKAHPAAENPSLNEKVRLACDIEHCLVLGE